MPGWIIESNDYRSSSDGGYIYDRRVPLMIYGGGITQKVVDESGDMCNVAPTICNSLGIDAPWSSEGTTLP
jgi:phosphoglycerol transferase MdoB-like AlkP superfamily enzyme